jgi:acetyltransferase-like isoleucine patch superfamily enzyme
MRFPRLRMSPDVHYGLLGVFKYGNACSIGTRSVLIIPETAALCFGDDVYIGRYVELGPGGRIDIGDATSVQDRSIVLGDVRIGRYCLFSPNVFVSSGTHCFDAMPAWLIRDQDKYVRQDARLAKQVRRPVQIDDDCWIGANAVILAGVTIGKGCIVGANSVVSQDLPPYSVAAGAPARVVKARLNYSPPATLNGLAEADHPYFYSGFGVAVQDRETARLNGGICAQASFSIALDIAGRREIIVTARSLGAGCQLVFGEQKAQLSTEFTTATFLLDPGAKLPLSFSVNAPMQAKWPVCVSRVSAT